MYCTFCHSNNQAEFPAEMMIHFSDIRNINYPGVLAFPKVSVCFDCGFSGFTTPETELRIPGKVSSALEPHRVRKGVSHHVRAGDQSRH